MEAHSRLAKVLDYCAKGLGFIGNGKALQFVFLSSDRRLF